MPKSIKKIKTNLIILVVVAILTATSFCNNNVYAYSYALTIDALGKTYSFSSYEIATFNGKKHLKNAGDIVDGIYLDTVVRPIDASITFTPQNVKKFQVNPGKNGIEIDKTALISDIDRALNEGDNYIKAKTNVINKLIDENELLKCTFLRSSFTTYYDAAAMERKHNIMLASNSINGVCINDGEEFSFNNVVGERSEKRGYKQAKIIIDGNFTDGVGGGVCQVSTTLYNAIILSGLKVTEQHSHSLQVGYVEPSFDAMVSYNSSDLKFVNVTGGKVFIAVYLGENYIKFEVYGKKLIEQYERVSVIIDKIKPQATEEIESDELFIGQSQIIQNDKYGIKSEGYLITYKDGQRVKNVKIRKDSYKPIRGKILIGTKPIENKSQENCENLVNN